MLLQQLSKYSLFEHAPPPSVALNLISSDCWLSFSSLEPIVDVSYGTGDVFASLLAFLYGGGQLVRFSAGAC